MEAKCIRVFFPLHSSKLLSSNNHYQGYFLFGWINFSSGGLDIVIATKLEIAYITKSGCLSCFAKDLENSKMKPQESLTLLGVWLPKFISANTVKDTYSSENLQCGKCAEKKLRPWLILVETTLEPCVILSLKLNGNTPLRSFCHVIKYNPSDFNVAAKHLSYGNNCSLNNERTGWNASMERIRCAHIIEAHFRQQILLTEMNPLDLNLSSNIMKLEDVESQIALLLFILLPKLVHHFQRRLPSFFKQFYFNPQIIASGPLQNSLFVMYVAKKFIVYNDYCKAAQYSHKNVDVEENHNEKMCQSFYHYILDLILGFMFAYLLYYHQQHLSLYIENCTQFLQPKALQKDIKWLSHHPAGLKLNLPLAIILGEALILIVNKYWDTIGLLLSYSNILLKIVCMCAVFGGFSVAIAFLYDLAQIFTLHITLVYKSLSLLYGNHIKILSSLWLLFCGKKKNMLRNRVDSCIFDIPQMVLGTLCFTVLLLLLPTITVMYFFFSLLKAAKVVLNALLGVSFILISRFPAYELVTGRHGFKSHGEIDFLCMNNVNFSKEIWQPQFQTVYMTLEPKKFKAQYILRRHYTTIYYNMMSEFSFGKIISSWLTGSQLPSIPNIRLVSSN